jgi:hypothetical protein
MGMPGMPRPMHRGMPKAVPVVVSAGLAVGVFCGLLFGIGTGKKDAIVAPSKATNAKDHPVEDTTHLVETPTKPLTPTAQLGKGSGGGAGAGSGSAVAMAGSAVAGSAAASGVGSGSAIAPEGKKLTFKVEPDAAAQVAKIQIDGKEIAGTSIELPADKKQVKVSISASGFHDLDKNIDLELLGPGSTVELQMVKRAAPSPGFGGTDTRKPTVPARPPGGDSPKPPPKKKPAGGLIDI